ncbi:hypothetical protein [Vibrio sp. A1-1]|uniref:hypothetical protein n=1 Tax=Vibrio sp. A1-1 TaxID=2912250 RepID=UPI001F1745DE|nr:hypothetical protein [Vibrio sp. A1-1]MCF7455160.1 hypothetical protein [Vibrio sp. A1-1]
MDTKINIYSRNLNGHRNSYTKVFEEELHAKNLNFKACLFSPKPMFFLMVEDSFFIYVLTAIIRSLLGLKTLGLVFSVKPVLNHINKRYRAKYYALRLIKFIPGISSVSIVPFYVDSRIKKICTDYIYDPQFWDLGKDELTFFENLSRYNLDCNVVKYIESLKFDLNEVNDKKVVSIGEQSFKKGTPEFIKLSYNYHKNDIRFIYSGKLDSESKKCIAEHCNDLLTGVDRFITDKEIMFSYFLSDVVWCCYHADYDQASGIFGRALQLGKPVFVRKDSYLHLICLEEGVIHFAMDDLTTVSDVDVFIRSITKEPLPLTKTFSRKKHSLDSLKGIYEK